MRKSTPALLCIFIGATLSALYGCKKGLSDNAGRDVLEGQWRFEKCVSTTYANGSVYQSNTQTTGFPNLALFASGAIQLGFEGYVPDTSTWSYSGRKFVLGQKGAWLLQVTQKPCLVIELTDHAFSFLDTVRFNLDPRQYTETRLYFSR